MGSSSSLSPHQHPQPSTVYCPRGVERPRKALGSGEASPSFFDYMVKIEIVWRNT